MQSPATKWFVVHLEQKKTFLVSFHDVKTEKSQLKYEIKFGLYYKLHTT